MVYVDIAIGITLTIFMLSLTIWGVNYDNNKVEEIEE
jgi:hypothetical protein